IIMRVAGLSPEFHRILAGDLRNLYWPAIFTRESFQPDIRNDASHLASPVGHLAVINLDGRAASWVLDLPVRVSIVPLFVSHNDEVAFIRFNHSSPSRSIKEAWFRKRVSDPCVAVSFMKRLRWNREYEFQRQ